jgi:predicted RNA-binding protein with PUA-like domain
LFSLIDVLYESAKTGTPMKTKTSKKSKPPGKNKKKAAAAHWLVKQEPETYSWSDFVSDGGTDWTGVRNYQARNNLREMKTGERVLFYHSGKDKAVVGLAEVAKGAYPDPTADDEQWVAVDLKPVRALKNPVPLAAIRYDKRLSQLPLIRQSQLSVMSLTKDEFEILVATGEGKKGKK